MRNKKLEEIKALYSAYKNATVGKDYLKKAVNIAINDFLTLYVTNYAANGNTSNNIDIPYKEYYQYGKQLHKILNYEMMPSEIYKLQGCIEVPF
jgi:hypothetical protein